MTTPTRLWPVFGILLSLCFGMGCMETTLSVDDVENRIRVRARLRTADTITPLPGVQLTLLDSSQRGVITSAITDQTGNALLLATGKPVRSLTFVDAAALGNLQPNPKRTAVAVCEDTTVAIEFIRPVDCASISGQDSIIFRDATSGSLEIVRNQPPTLEQCWAFRYTGNAPATVQLPTVIPQPFSFIRAEVNGQGRPINAAVTLQPGDMLVLCFAVSTANVGVFTEQVQFTVPCPNTSGQVVVRLKATVVPERCDCSSADIELLVPEPILVGQRSETVAEVLYQNVGSSCPVTLQFIRATAGTDQRWTVTPALGQAIEVQPDGRALYSAQFRPTQVGSFSDTVFYRITLPDGRVCEARAVLIGCVLQCPQIELQDGRRVPLGQGNIRDITKAIIPALPCDPGSSTFFEPNEGNFRYTLVNPSLCSPVTVSADLGGFNYGPAAPFIRLSSRSLTLSPSGSANITITQDNIPITLVRDFAAQFPGRPLEITARLSLSTTIPGCDEQITVTFPIDTVPPLSPPNTLIAYKQTVSPIKTDPDYTVFILDEQNGRTAPNTYESWQLGEDRNNATPQNNGDLFVTVQDVNVDATTDPRYTSGQGQLPRLNIRTGSRIVEGAFWTKMSSQQFAQRTGPTGVLSRFSQAVGGLTFNITPGSPRTMADNATEAGNVYAFRVRSGSPDNLGGTCNDVYALVFIRGVDNGFGTFATTTRQSQVQIQVMYPVYGR